MSRLSNRWRDAAVVLPLVGLFLLMPPTITLFTAWHHVAGVPLIVAYLFGVWIALIAGAALLARRIARAERAEREAADGPGRNADEGQDAAS